MTELVESALRKEYSTIVGVGDDEIANNIASSLVGRKEAMGFIPLEVSSSLAALLGTDNWKKACETLRYRKITEMRLGKTATGNYFLTELKLGNAHPVDITLEFKDYFLQAKAKDLTISNFSPGIKKIGDDFLDIIFHSINPNVSAITKVASFLGIEKNDEQLSYSLLRGRSLRVFTKSPIPLLSGTAVIAKTPQLIESSDEKLRLITSKSSTTFWA